MKKSLKFLLAAALIVVAVNASAQFGIKVGYVNSATKFKAEDISVKPENQNGFYAGFHYDIATSVTGLSVRPGLFYTYIGGESVFEGMTDLGGYGIKLKDRDHTLSIPLDLKYAYNVTDDFKIYAFAGPRFAVGLVYLMKMKQSGTSASVNIYTGKATIKDDGESVSEELDDADFASRFDLQLGLGAGIQYKRVSLEVGYDWGMLNRIKSDYVYDDETVKRSKFVVGLGVSF